MLSALRNLFHTTTLTVPRKRALDAAGGGRRWADDRSGLGEAPLWIRSGGAIVAARAQSYVLNNGHGARILECLAANLVGTGIVPRPMHPSEGVRSRLMRDWTAWTDNADAEGRMDLYGLQNMAVRDMATFGEALFGFTADAVTGAPQLLRLHPEQLDRAKTLQLEDGGVIVQGVEFGPTQHIRAYWIRPHAPGAALAGLPLVSRRFAASDVLHLFRPLVPGQVRGISWFVSILLSAHDLDQFMDAMLMRAKVAAMFVGSVSNDIDANAFDGTVSTDGTAIDVTVEPGTIRRELPGEKLDWNEPPAVGDGPQLAREIARMMAAGAGVTYEQLTGDYSQVNYSSARTAQLEFRRFAEGVQHHTLVFQLCRPLWQRFTRYEVLRGAISAASYRADPAAFEAVKWLPPKWDWIDPLKDAQAAILEIEHGLTSRAQVVSERGYDVEALDQEIAADKAREARLGLKFGGPITPESIDAAP